MELRNALPIAENIVKLLAPDCNLIDIAGSCRREKPEVKDIEIVCLPKKTVLKDMFGWDEGIITDLKFQNKVENIGKIMKGKIDGKYIQIELPQGINLDLFMPLEHDYYRQFAIRTGSADYSFKVIAAGWRRMGWCGTNVGLRKIFDCEEVKLSNEKSKWECQNKNAELPPIWKSEEEFFQWIKVKWIEPTQRSI